MSKKMLMSLAIAGLVSGCATGASDASKESTSHNGCGSNGCGKNGCGKNGCGKKKAKDGKNCCQSEAKKKSCDKGSNGCGANTCGGK